MSALIGRAQRSRRRRRSRALPQRARRPSRSPSTMSASARLDCRVVAGDHARASGRAADQRLHALSRPRGRGSRAARRAAAARARASTARAAATRCTIPRESSCSGSSARVDIPTASEGLLHARVAERVQARVKAQVLARRELAIEERVVAEPADAAAQGPAFARELATEHAQEPGLGAKQAREDAQQRGLAGSVRAEHRERLARRQRERHRFQRGALAEVASQALQLQSERDAAALLRRQALQPSVPGHPRSARARPARRRPAAARSGPACRRRSIRRRPCESDRWATCPSPSRAAPRA